MRFHVRGVRELSWKKYMAVFPRELFTKINAAKKATLLASDGDDLGTETTDQIDALATHPVRHKDLYGMSECATDSRECNSGVAARSFDYRIPWLEQAGCISLPEDVQGHSVFDTSS
jgi:hypothetical protein